MWAYFTLVFQSLLFNIFDFFMATVIFYKMDFHIYFVNSHLNVDSKSNAVAIATAQSDRKTYNDGVFVYYLYKLGFYLIMCIKG